MFDASSVTLENEIGRYMYMGSISKSEPILTYRIRTYYFIFDTYVVCTTKTYTYIHINRLRPVTKVNVYAKLQLDSTLRNMVISNLEVILSRLA